MLGNTNAKVGNSGGSVEVLEQKNNLFIKDDFHRTTGGFGYQLPGYLFIEKDLAIYWYAQYGSSRKGVGIYKIVKSGTHNTSITDQEQSFVSLDFGQTYMSTGSISMKSYASLSPDKSKLVVLHYGSTPNIYLIPVSKNGDNYSLGEVTTITVSDYTSANQVRFINNDTFLVLSSPNIYCYKIENDNTLTLIATFTNSEQITGFLNIGEVIMITNSSSRKVWFLDNIVSQNIIYTETLTTAESFTAIASWGNNSFVADNKFFLSMTYNSTTNTTPPFKVFSLENGSITLLTFTGDLNINNGLICASYVYQIENDKISIFLVSRAKKGEYSYAYWIFSIEMDFSLLTVKENAICIGEIETTINSSAGYTGYFDGEDAYIRASYQSDTWWQHFSYSQETVITKLGYDGFEYEIKNQLANS